ncbi:AlpA family phage regulatory protein [Lysobacter maris]|uniref:AlpA family phage regulatory protein n=1 Tax=Marilutibacter maris TaxID=1605891 RepID=A0A508AFT0_9GAMM|nr:AlpA family phage regulatory protein [Lysobacter maris]
MHQHDQRYLSDRDLAVRYGINRATVWRWSDAGTLPQPVKLSPGCTRWRLSDIQAFEADRAKAAA